MYKLVNGLQNQNLADDNVKRMSHYSSNKDSKEHFHFATCALWGKDHYRTFENNFYQFPGK